MNAPLHLNSQGKPHHHTGGGRSVSKLDASGLGGSHGGSSAVAMEAAGVAEAAGAPAGKPNSGHLEPASILASEIVSATISAATAPSFSKSLEKCFSSGARPRPRLFQSQPLPHTEVSNTKNLPKICKTYAYNNLKKFRYALYHRK